MIAPGKRWAYNGSKSKNSASNVGRIEADSHKQNEGVN